MSLHFVESIDTLEEIMLDDVLSRLKVGDEDEFEHVITAQDVASFVQLTGDDNPLHVDEQYAKKTSFHKPVAHGMLTASFISTMIGTRLPGPGALWYEQSLKFLAPVRVGESIRVHAKIIHISKAQRVVVIETNIYKTGGQQVIAGEGKVKIVEVESPDTAKKLEKDTKGAVIISGSSRGIGAAVARELSQEGFAVCINYNSDKDSAASLCDEICSSGGRAIVFQANISDPNAVADMVDATVSSFQVLEGIVCNASPPAEVVDFSELTWEMFQRHFDTQVGGAFNLTKASMPLLLEESSAGCVVMVSSVFADNVPPIKQAPYIASKSALNALAKSIAAEYGAKGVRVNIVSPGMTETGFIVDTPQKVKMMAKMQTPLRKLGQPEDIAGVVGFLFSDKAKHLTGQNIRICGGSIML